MPGRPQNRGLTVESSQPLACPHDGQRNLSGQRACATLRSPFDREAALNSMSGDRENSAMANLRSSVRHMFYSRLAHVVTTFRGAGSQRDQLYSYRRSTFRFQRGSHRQYGYSDSAFEGKRV